jgi:hypothetical protein
LISNPNVYKLGVLINIREVQNIINVEEFESQIHFDVGNPLRGNLKANSRSYAQPFSLWSVVLDS